MIRNFGATGLVGQPTGLDLGFSGGSNIKSIQRGVFSYETSNEKTVTISSIDPTKSIILVSNTAGPSYKRVTNKAEIVSPTQIKFTNGDANGFRFVAWEVIEFNNVKSVQRGTLTLSTSSNDNAVTISSVNPSKSIVLGSQASTGANEDYVQLSSEIVLTNATTITISNESWQPGITYHWQAIEFN